MKTTISENEANRVAGDAITLALQKLPYDGQDELDRDMAEHFLLKGLASKVNSRLTKLDDKAKSAFKDGATAPVLSKNYRREVTSGTSRNLFDVDEFISLICEKYPELLPHNLRELSTKAKKLSAAPLSVTIEYIGDIARPELP